MEPELVTVNRAKNMQMDLAMGPRGKLNIILLNEHSSKMTPNYLLLGSIFLSPHQRCFS